MNFSTPCQIHQLNHAFNTSLPLYHSWVNLSIEATFHRSIARLKRLFINNYHFYPNAKCECKNERRGLLIPKTPLPNSIFSNTKHPSTTKTWTWNYPNPRCTEILAPTATLFQYTWMNPPNSTNKLHNEQNQPFKTPSSILTYQLV